MQGLDEYTRCIALSLFTLGGGRCKTILGVEQGLGETLFLNVPFDTVLSYISNYSMFFPFGKHFCMSYSDMTRGYFFISPNYSMFRLDFLSQYRVFSEISSEFVLLFL